MATVVVSFNGMIFKKKSGTKDWRSTSGVERADYRTSCDPRTCMLPLRYNCQSQRSQRSLLVARIAMYMCSSSTELLEQKIVF